MSTTAAFRRTSGAWRRFFSTNNISGNPIAYLDRVYADTDSLARGVLSSDRGSLARAITLVESTRVEHQKLAAALLRALQPRLRSSTARTLRVGVSGPPGAGKSTLLEALGCEYVSRGHRVAVLAIDPSSASTGGAILGDKTRMPRLSCSPAAFVRPTPSRGTLGGVARATWDAALLCQAAGYDRVLIETVGVGQSETAVADLADAFLLVLPPAGGDELQGIKRGITEVADIVAVNKADGATQVLAKRAAAAVRAALHLLAPRRASWQPQVLALSAQEGTGVPELAAAIEEFRDRLEEGRELERARKRQRAALAWTAAQERALDALRQSPAALRAAKELREAVEGGDVVPRVAAEKIYQAFAAER